jgi:sugar phosphate isomerase/epimerase
MNKEKEMKLSLTTGTYGKTAFDTALQHIRGYGFDAVEITAISGAKHHVDCAQITLAEIETLRRRLRELKLEVAAINGGPCGPFLEDYRLPYVYKTIDLAAALGAPVVVFSSRKPPEIERYSPDELRADLMKKMRLCGDYALKMGIRLALETEPGSHYIENPQVGLDILEEINHPAVNYNLCVPHILAAGENVEDIIERAGSRIVHTHISDLQGRIHKHLIPGLGDVNLPDLFSRLEKIGYQGALCFDLYPYVDTPDEAAAETYKYMARLKGLV